VTVRRAIEVTVTVGPGDAPSLLKPALRLATLKAVYLEARNQGLSGVEIAAQLGISANMVRKDLRDLGLPLGARRGSNATAAAVAASRKVRKERVQARTEKVCPRCERGPQPLSAFGSNKANADGVTVWCRSCVNETQRRYRSRVVADWRAWASGSGTLTAMPAPLPASTASKPVICPACHKPSPPEAFIASNRKRCKRCAACRAARPSAPAAIPAWAGSLDHHAPRSAVGMVPAVAHEPDVIEWRCCVAEYSDGRWQHERSCPARRRPAARVPGRQQGTMAAVLSGKFAGHDELIAQTLMPWRR
jgi:hypothetical protein